MMRNKYVMFWYRLIYKFIKIFNSRQPGLDFLPEGDIHGSVFLFLVGSVFNFEVVIMH